MAIFDYLEVSGSRCGEREHRVRNLKINLQKSSGARGDFLLLPLFDAMMYRAVYIPVCVGP